MPVSSQKGTPAKSKAAGSWIKTDGFILSPQMMQVWDKHSGGVEPDGQSRSTLSPAEGTPSPDFPSHARYAIAPAASGGARQTPNGGALSGKRKRRKCIVIPGEGDPCPRCREPMQIREYDGIGEKERHHYTRWFCCLNKTCKTTLVMPARYKVASVG
jgi:hypothetical protein